MYPTFLPIQFFKSNTVLPLEIVPENLSETLQFQSSGTTLQNPSQHWILQPNLYKNSFHTAFQSRFGNPKNLCIIGLLPSYLERNNSSLVYMVNSLIQSSEVPGSGFYLNQYEALWQQVLHNENYQIPTVIFGVTFALLDLADWINAQAENKFFEPMKFIQWVETGGMKGRGKELTRQELHSQLRLALNCSYVHSEYGMTELLSQAYTRTLDGKFLPPPWMKILICDPLDPQDFLPYGKTGRICIIDLANLYSCCFIATDDIGKLYEDGSFEVLGRLDYSDLRGCNQLI